MALSITDYLARGPATSKEIQAATGLGQSAVARQLRNMGDSVIPLKEGRSLRYVVTKNAFGGDDKLPLAMVDPHGNTVMVALVRPLLHGGFFVEQVPGMPNVLLGESGDGIYEDLPYFLSDLSPQGFLGRQVATDLSSQSDDFPSDPKRWNSNHIGRYLTSNGDDLPGNFKFGPNALLRVRRKPVVTTEADYPELADSVMSGVIPGSSAGGEQPKFTAYCGTRSAHVIVKFSPKGDSETARRWRDILITEFHATEALHHADHPAAETRLIELDGRLFLESNRFDRSGEYGRTPMISLQSVDAEFVGIGNGWPQVINALYKKELLQWAHVCDAEILWGFGRLINNTDMHLGNLSLGIDGNIFRILPVYDMCSMGFAPKSNGETPPYNFTPPLINGVNLEPKDLGIAEVMAYDFWKRVSKDERISDEFKQFLDAGNPLERLIVGPFH